MDDLSLDKSSIFIYFFHWESVIHPMLRIRYFKRRVYSIANCHLKKGWLHMTNISPRSLLNKFQLLAAVFISISSLILGTFPAFAASGSNHVPRISRSADPSHMPRIPLNYYPTAQLTNKSCDYDPNAVWHINQKDQYGYTENWAETTDLEVCAGANWNLNGTYSYYYTYMWVPSSYADAYICLGFYNSGSKQGTACVDETSWTDCWAFVTDSIANVQQVKLTSNNGQLGDYIGIGATSASLLLTPYSYSGSC